MTELAVKNLSFNYDNAPNLIDNLSLAWPIGDFSLLIGPTGCGKSTLMKLLADLLQPQQGKICRQGRVGMMFQEAGEQFTMATPRDEIIFALENLQVSPQQYPARLDYAVATTQIGSLLDQEIVTMSGGQKQRVALAVLLAMNTDILLLDEPFASVDPEGRRFLIAKLSQLQQAGKTIIISDHLLDDYADVVQHVFSFSKQGVTELDETEKNQLFHPSPQVQGNFATDVETSCFTLTQTQLTTNQLILNQEHLQLAKGKITLITGKNGVGKTSLFRALSKLMPYNGNISYEGSELAQLKARKYLQEVAQVFQTATDQFLRVTVGEELALSKQHRNAFYTDKRIQQVLEEMNLADKLDQSVYTLSGGQKKLLQLLIMLITNHRVLLIDEPLSGLDANACQLAVKLIKENQTALQQSILIISHQTRLLLPICDYHLEFANQRLVYREVWPWILV